LFRPAKSFLIVLIIWILLEIVSNFVQQTPNVAKRNEERARQLFGVRGGFESRSDVW